MLELLKLFHVQTKPSRVGEVSEDFCQESKRSRFRFCAMGSSECIACLSAAAVCAVEVPVVVIIHIFVFL